MMPDIAHRLVVGGSIAWLTLLMVGCGRLETEYGRSTGHAGKSSLNGFGALRALYQMRDWQTRSISRIGPRVQKLDAIVWTPSVNVSVSEEATTWFEQWLADDGKTLVVVVYDGGSEAAYWHHAARLTTPLQRLEYRRRAARAELEQLREFLQQPAPDNNGWYALRERPFPEALGRPSGAWAPDADGAPSATAAGAVAVRANGAVAAPPDGAVAASGEGAISAPPDGGYPFPLLRYDVVPYRDSQSSPPRTTVARPRPADDSSEVATHLQPLLVSEAGVPVVTRVSSPAWRSSQVLVVSAGSLLTNFGISQPLGRVLAAHLVGRSGPPGEVGFLTTGWSGIDVSQNRDGKPGRSGMELLTVWPLSLVTIHASLLGLVVCLILMPIFGRPRNPRQHSQSDFVDHLDAVAVLLGRTGGDQYARQRISDYMRRVRGETTGPWVLPEPERAAPTRPPRPTLEPRSQPPSPPADLTASSSSEGPVATDGAGSTEGSVATEGPVSIDGPVATEDPVSTEGFDAAQSPPGGASSSTRRPADPPASGENR